MQKTKGQHIYFKFRSNVPGSLHNKTTINFFKHIILNLKSKRNTNLGYKGLFTGRINLCSELLAIRKKKPSK